MKRKINGFTLLELLVVIGIIGILVALATVSYSTTQKSSRDARRKQDMVAIQNALEQYYSENVFKYPNGMCATAVVNMKSEWPVDPDGSNYIQSCTGDAYCVCALMEKAGSGNAGPSSGSTCDFNGNKNYYCVSNLQ
ncbi:MAG TPA: type II secretion system protein [Spirochaetia bacterium]|nr:type II secretion system protein [Spirochaetia bacterium]